MITPNSGARSRMDYGLSVAVVLLVAIGLIMVFSTTFTMKDDPAYYLKLQVMWACIGLSAFVILSRIDYHKCRPGHPVMVLSVLGLLVVLIVGGVRNGAQSWLFKASGQPTEYAKLGFVIYIAAWLASKGTRFASSPMV